MRNALTRFSAWAPVPLVVFAVLVSSSTLLAQPAPDPVPASPPSDRALAGRQVAIRECGECHAVDPGRISPFAPAPPFPGLYKIFPVERLDEVLVRGLLADHPNMSAFQIDEDERLALTAYLSSFRPQARPKGVTIAFP